MKNKVELIKYGQSGIVYDAGLTTTDTIYISQDETDLLHVYVSGTLKNNSASSQQVKLSLIGFEQGEVKITLLAGETMELKNIRLRQFFAMSASSNIEVMLIRTFSAKIDLLGSIIKR